MADATGGIGGAHGGDVDRLVGRLQGIRGVDRVAVFAEIVPGATVTPILRAAFSGGTPRNSTWKRMPAFLIALPLVLVEKPSANSMRTEL